MYICTKINKNKKSCPRPRVNDSRSVSNAEDDDVLRFSKLTRFTPQSSCLIVVLLRASSRRVTYVVALRICSATTYVGCAK